MSVESIDIGKHSVRVLACDLPCRTRLVSMEAMGALGVRASSGLYSDVSGRRLCTGTIVRAVRAPWRVRILRSKRIATVSGRYAAN